MLALAELERHVHARCGQPLEDVMDPDADRDPITGRRARYVPAPAPRRCFYCTAHDQGVEKIRAEVEEGTRLRHDVGALVVRVIDRGKDR